MATVTLLSLGHSPGTTTAAVALTSRWPRRAVLVEADTSVTSAVLAGRLRGAHPHERGLTALAGAAQHDRLGPEALWSQTLELAAERWLIPGFSTLGAARGAASFWGPLAGALSAVAETQAEVIIDLGRCPAADPRIVLAAGADLVLVVTGCSLPAIAATLAPATPQSTALGELTELLGDLGHADALRLLAIDTAAENYSATEITAATGTPVIATLPFTPSGVAEFASGAPAARRRAREGYARAIDGLIQHSRQRIDERRARLAPPTAARRVEP